MSIDDGSFSSSESVGFGSQIGDSIKGILAGIVLFPLSIYCIFKVETCTQAGDAFKKAVPVTQKEEGKPIYVTGKLTADPVGSKFIKPGNYIRVSQTSQVYAWDETTRTEGKGSKKEKITECKLKWTSNPDDPQKFKDSRCRAKKYHKITFPSSSATAGGAKVTADGKSYGVNLKDVDFASAVKSAEPASGDIITNGYTIGEKYLYEFPDCASSPKEGCERIDLSVTPIPEGEMTFLGDLNGSNLTKYVYDGEQFLNASVGTYAQTMQAVKSDDSMKKWFGRIAGFVMMWASFVLMTGPLMTLLEFIPFVGEFGAGALRFVFGVVAFVITAITIILVKFWYIWLLLILGALGYGIYKRKFADQAQSTT
ncbi:MAG: hypothetical protein KDK36_04320 [Leptospiraceae bacterium]|nr:hypothetical protein [Leptospiraceae bacterium]